MFSLFICFRIQHSYSMKANLPDFRENALLSFYNIPNWFPYYSAYTEVGIIKLLQLFFF